MNLRSILCISSLALSSGVLQTIAFADGPQLATLDRLQAAYRSEMLAQVRYAAYAAKADEDGYKQVANLFRAVARSEQIMYTNFYDAIKEIGGTPADVVTDPPPVGTTKENLEKSSSKTEFDQFDADFTIYAKSARAEGNKTAAKVFDYARAVELQSFRLLSLADKNLENMRGNPRGYYLCGVTGFISPNMESANCSSPDWERVR